MPLPSSLDTERTMWCFKCSKNLSYYLHLDLPIVLRTCTVIVIRKRKGKSTRKKQVCWLKSCQPSAKLRQATRTLLGLLSWCLTFREKSSLSTTQSSCIDWDTQSYPISAPCTTRQRKLNRRNRSFHTERIYLLWNTRISLLGFPFLLNDAQRKSF